jgi:hypothetical protein
MYYLHHNSGHNTLRPPTGLVTQERGVILWEKNVFSKDGFIALTHMLYPSLSSFEKRAGGEVEKIQERFIEHWLEAGLRRLLVLLAQHRNLRAMCYPAILCNHLALNAHQVCDRGKAVILA